MLDPVAVHARNWNQEPQPVVAGPRSDRYELLADPRSGLAFDSGWRVLFYSSNGKLAGHHWNGSYFKQVRFQADAPPKLKAETALLVDETWHLAYFIGPDDRLRFSHPANGGWRTKETVAEPLSDLLGVDQQWHAVYAYSEQRRAIMAVFFDQKARRWASVELVSNIGHPGGEGVVDGAAHVLYSTHADFPAADGSNPLLDGSGPFVGAEWPLVATWWTGTEWKSRRVTDTGVPQKPAWNPVNQRLYFSRWNGRTEWLQLNRPRTILDQHPGIADAGQSLSEVPRLLATQSGSLPNALGLSTWEDHQRYVINYNEAPYYGGGSSGSSGNVIIGGPISFVGPPVPATWEKVICYKPVWSNSPLPARVSSWTGVVSPRRGELVHQQGWHEAGDLMTASGWVEVPDMYRTSTGVYFQWTPDWESQLSWPVYPPYTTTGTPGIFTQPGVPPSGQSGFIVIPSIGQSGSSGPGGLPDFTLPDFTQLGNPGGPSSTPGPNIIGNPTVTGPEDQLTSLGSSELPANPETPQTVATTGGSATGTPTPIEQREIFDGRVMPRADLMASSNPTYYFGSLVVQKASRSLFRLVGDAVAFSPEAPLPGSRLADAPAGIHTFGVKLASPEKLRPGGRYMNYAPALSSRAWAGGVAADRRSLLVFYTQAPQAVAQPAPRSIAVFADWPFTSEFERVSRPEFHTTGDQPMVIGDRPVWISIIW